MKTFDSIREKALNIGANEELALKSASEIIIPYKERLGNNYELLLEELSSLDVGFRELISLMTVLYEKAILDPIGLYTKAYLEDKLPALDLERDLAYIMGDVDRFHRYNAVYGHLQGDIALTSIAQQFKKSIEERLCEDEAPLIARYGGEELCAFIRNYQRDNKTLYQLTEGIRGDIEKLDIQKLPEAAFKKEGYKRSTITLAAGIRKKDESINLLMQEINSLLIKKEKRGRNKVYLRR